MFTADMSLVVASDREILCSAGTRPAEALFARVRLTLVKDLGSPGTRPGEADLGNTPVSPRGGLLLAHEPRSGDREEKSITKKLVRLKRPSSVKMAIAPHTDADWCGIPARN